MGITPKQFLSDLNPMFPEGERRLSLYVTELRDFDPNRPCILLINNSSLPFVPGQGHPLGVMHKAEIPEPRPTERRAVNSIVLGVTQAGRDVVGPEGQNEFVRTETISQRY